MVYTVAIKCLLVHATFASYCPTCVTGEENSVDCGPVHLACNPLPMLTHHQQLIELHVRRKGQLAAVPFFARQGLKVSRYHIGAAPYVFAKKKKKKREPHLP